MKRIGYGFDWDRVIDTTDENYYKWTQWIFLQMFKRTGLQSQDFENFCPECRWCLPRGVAKRHLRPLRQRSGTKRKGCLVLKIRAYAERLFAGLDKLDYPEKIKVEQQNWIGKSNGADVKFTIRTTKSKEIVVYTTRPDTIFGATFLVIAPEHPIVEEFIDSLENIEEVREYQRQAKLKKEFERVHMSKEKSGVRLNGICAVNPLTNKEIPVFIADYVIMDYGTGAIMAVPAHDTRDYEFAKKYNLPIIEVIKGGDIEKEAYVSKEGGEMVNWASSTAWTCPKPLKP